MAVTSTTPVVSTVPEKVEVDALAIVNAKQNTDEFDEGEHTIKAVATDTSGQEGETEIVVTVDRTPPEVELTSPDPEGSVGDEVLLAADAAVKEATGRKGKGLFMPLRKAVTGRQRGPEMADVMPLLQVKPKV